MERQELWPRFAEQGLHMAAHSPPTGCCDICISWGRRWFSGAAFHLFFSTKKHPETIALLRHWLFGATLAQVVIGIPLLFSVGSGLDWPALLAVTVGVAAAMLALWVLRPDTRLFIVGPRSLLVLLPVVFVAMLTARQFLQDRDLAPGHAQAVAYREERSKTLTPYHKQALEAFTIKLATVYDNGETIFDGACTPCHGILGRGDGLDAQNLLVPAADLTAIRADRDYVYGILKDGTPGSAMPYFRLYDREKLERLLDTLSKRFSMFAVATKPAHEPSLDALTVWEETCSVCHGTNGEPTPFGRTLLPAPPDLRRFTVTPERAFAVITEGYPGTVMQPFRPCPRKCAVIWPLSASLSDPAGKRMRRALASPVLLFQKICMKEQGKRARNRQTHCAHWNPKAIAAALKAGRRRGKMRLCGKRPDAGRARLSTACTLPCGSLNNDVSQRWSQDDEYTTRFRDNGR